MGLKKLFDSGYKEMKRCEKLAYKIEALEPEIKKLTDEELKNKTVEFRQMLNDGKTLDDILIEAYAVAREAAFRVTGMKAFHVQLIGGCAIHGGNIAEMKTGEGKTLTEVMPAYLNALSGKGVHIVTVNEYLARREAEGEIGEVFRFLGLSVGLNVRELSSAEKREAYSCDILYSTNSELGFDYLRDNMVHSESQITQCKGLNYAIIDEVDSILIDEARTPLIISGAPKNNSSLYLRADTFAKRLSEEDYEIEIETRHVQLTPSGMEKAEQVFNVPNIYDLQYVELVHAINNALKANFIFANGKEYVVQDGEVLIVDSFTGRILKGRQYSEGLHQAIEAKENVEIKKETQTVATITYQNFFRMYNKLSGMTGTAKTEEEEFRNIYNMYVVEVPTNRPVIRKDMPDLIFVSQKAKFAALVEEVKNRYSIGQPVLVGTANVETSELVSQMLVRAGVPHEVLNAKNNEREAEIVAKAGQKKSVTISTNMAGRGTDIKLGEGVVELGGLVVLGTERHESRRIDNQLRGRSGRQGDPGFSQFYISTEDDLIQRFGGDTFKNRLAMIINLMNRDTGNMDAPMTSRMISKAVTSAQTRVEGNNFDSRKNVLKYDDVIRRQREIFYEQRMQVVKVEQLEELVRGMMHRAVEDVCYSHMRQITSKKFEIDDDAIAQSFNGPILPPNSIDVSVLKTLDDEGIVEYIANKSYEFIDNNKKAAEEAKEKYSLDLPDNLFDMYLKDILLRVLDQYWMKHIDDMQGLRQGVVLQSYAQTNPLEIYQQEGYARFERLNQNINREILKYVTHTRLQFNAPKEEVDPMKGLTTNEVKDESVKKKPVEKKEHVGPNDPCPCGSGKKYKFCHGLK
ncbi:MAG: preprotein translocase subunit SecA [Anaeroplasmataceae bacterium]|nr:preprotein translocase subunit SecA [Anaeroplasmataceae bacterium]